jgi:hypothetical protein
MNKTIITALIGSFIVPSQGLIYAQEPSSPNTAPIVELSDGAKLRAKTILEGKPIVFQNGKFELIEQ